MKLGLCALVCIGVGGVTGCHPSATDPPVAKANSTIIAPRSLDEKLIGVWETGANNDRIEYTFTKDGKYVQKWGRPKYISGVYEERGHWDITSGGRLELVPESRKDTVANSDHEFAKTIHEHEKAMDEGAWKPMPTKINFKNDDSYTESFDSAQSEPIRYQRVRPTKA